MPSASTESRAATWFAEIVFCASLAVHTPDQWAGTLGLRLVWTPEDARLLPRTFGVLFTFTGDIITGGPDTPLTVGSATSGTPITWGAEPGNIGVNECKIALTLGPNPSTSVLDPYILSGQFSNLSGFPNDNTWYGDFSAPILVLDGMTLVTAAVGPRAPYHSAGEIEVFADNNTNFLDGPSPFTINVTEGGGSARFWENYVRTDEQYPLLP